MPRKKSVRKHEVRAELSNFTLAKAKSVLKLEMKLLNYATASACG